MIIIFFFVKGYFVDIWLKMYHFSVKRSDWSAKNKSIHIFAKHFINVKSVFETLGSIDKNKQIIQWKTY